MEGVQRLIERIQQLAVENHELKARYEELAKQRAAIVIKDLTDVKTFQLN